MGGEGGAPPQWDRRTFGLLGEALEAKNWREPSGFLALRLGMTIFSLRKLSKKKSNGHGGWLA